MPRKLSPALLSRIDRLSGCQGRWIVDCRELEGDYSYAMRDLHEPCLYGSLLVPIGDYAWCWALYRMGTLGLPFSKPTLEDVALYCAHTGWRSRLLFSPAQLDDTCSWPGGYDAPSIYRSNARVFRQEFAAALELADGDADGIALDVRYVTAEMIETIQALQDYPLIDEEDHSALELELQDEAWESWAASDWRRIVCAAIDEALPDGFGQDGDDVLDGVPDADSKLLELFNACRDQANVYWSEESDGSQWIDLERVGQSLDLADLRDLTGLALLPPDQTWRREPYPWPDGSSDPLVPALA